MSSPDHDEFEEDQARFRESFTVLKNLSSALSSPNPEPILAREVISTLGRYQEQPQLLDPYLEEMVLPLVSSIHTIVSVGPAITDRDIARLAIYCDILYTLTNVRGHKIIVKLFAHDVDDLSIVTACLGRSTTNELYTWKIRYILLLWLSLLALTPFDMSLFGTGESAPTSSEANPQVQLVDKLFVLGKDFISYAGKERDAAGILLARLTTRGDTLNSHLLPLIQWSTEHIQSQDPSILLVTGILSCLCEVARLASPDALALITTSLWACITAVSTNDAFLGNPLLRKLTVKLTNRLAFSLLPVRTRKLRRANLAHLSHNLSLAAKGADSTVDSPSQSTPSHDKPTPEEEGIDIPEELEDMISFLMEALADKSTSVRWSAAKGLMRIGTRLPESMFSQLIDPVWDLFQVDVRQRDRVNALRTSHIDISSTSDAVWHGSALVVAEGARRGLFTSADLPRIVQCIIDALSFDQRKGSHSVGSHIRDAACYIAWSVARGFSASEVEPYKRAFTETLLTAALFDREVHVCRAASAALQEAVGRWNTIHEGIPLITIVDYAAVGVRRSAFLDLSVQVANLGYGECLVRHLATVTCHHWDVNMRLLAAQALGSLSPLDPTFTAEVLLPGLYSFMEAPRIEEDTMHGGISAIGEILHSFPVDMSSTIDADLLTSLITLLRRIPARSLGVYGSVPLFIAVCRYIECLASLTWIPLSDDLQAEWLTFLLKCLTRPEEAIRQACASALRAYTQACRTISDDTFTLLLNGVSPSLTPSVDARKGHVVGLGSLRGNILREKLDIIVSTLATSSRKAKEKRWDDAHVREYSLRSLGEIAECLGSGLQGGMAKDITVSFLQGMRDYTTETQGDVGSWVRMAGVLGLEKVSASCIFPPEKDEASGGTDGKGKMLIPSLLVTRMVAALLRQSAERIDRVRYASGCVLSTILEGLGRVGGTAAQVPFQAEISQALNTVGLVEWRRSEIVLPHLLPLLRAPEYRRELLTGLVCSSASVNETTSEVAMAHLVGYLLGDKTLLPEWMAELAGMYEANRTNPRVLDPLLELSVVLLESGLLQAISNVDTAMFMLDFALMMARTAKGIRRIISCAKIICAFASVPSCRTKSFTAIRALLCHNFTQVRRETADHLYITLSSDEVFTEMEWASEAEAILLSVDWSSTEEERDAMADQLISLCLSTE